MEDCLFCKIANHTASAKIVSEDEELIVIENKFPKAPVHLLVMPKKHFSKITGHNEDANGLYDRLVKKCVEVALNLGLKDGNFKVIINGWGLAHFDHEHLHLLGGWEGPAPEFE